MESNMDKVTCGILHSAVVESYTVLPVSTCYMYMYDVQPEAANDEHSQEEGTLPKQEGLNLQ